MLFRCDPVGLDFADRARWRFRHEAELDASPAAVFDLFADGESWPRWFPGIRRVVWTSPEPKGVGTTRTVTLDSVTVYEHFLAWDPGRRFAFRFEAADRPLFRAGLEDYLLEPLPDGRTRFRYLVFLEPSWPVRLAGPLARAAFDRSFGAGAAGLQAHLARGREA